MHISSKSLGLLASIIPLLLSCGCFQAENPFYRKADIFNDKRFEGRFYPENVITNSTPSEFIVIKPGKDRHYTLTFHQNDKWVDLDAVLFKCGTNLFVDVSKIADNGVNSMPAVGPSGIEVMHLATLYDTHSVVRVRFVENGLQQGNAYGNPVYYALQKHAGLKFKKSTSGQPIDPHQKILTNPTEELYELLLDAGNDDTVFGFKSTWIKSKG
jgi:hypothetical protein